MIRFLTRGEVLAEQLVQLSTYGGGEPGIINPGSLDSAVEQPKASFGGEFLYTDLNEMATAYLVSLVKNHAFGNGNKRIGLSSALMFLFLNGVVIKASTEEVVSLVLDVIAGTRNREQAAEFFGSHVEPVATSFHSMRLAVGEPQFEEIVASPDVVADASRWVNTTFAEAFAILAQ